MEIKLPLVVINFKTYPQASGERGLLLAQTCEAVAKEYGVSVAVAPQIPDLYPICRGVDIPVLSQHMDSVEPGQNTGHIVGETLVEIGCRGTLLNHSERRMLLADVEGAVRRAELLNLMSIVCTNNVMTSVAAAAMRPNAVAIEPPELIGTGVSVSKSKPEVVAGTVAAIRSVNKDVVILCGAGISNGEDVRAAIDLGTQGVLLASAVTKSNRPADVLRDLLAPLRE